MLVMSSEEGFINDRLSCIANLWENNIKAELFYKKNSKLLTQIQYCEKELVPVGIIIGTEEKKCGGVKIRNISAREDKFVKNEDLIMELRALLSTKNS